MLPCSIVIACHHFMFAFIYLSTQFLFKINFFTKHVSRSWLHPLLSFRRLFEWHVVTFSLLLVLAFSNTLIWTLPFYLLVSSFVFWEIIFLGIVWIILEVWTMFGTSAAAGPSIYGYVVRLFFLFVILTYQTVYLHWACLSTPAQANSLRAMGDSNFWFWQYVWLSVIALSLYFLDCVVCVLPLVYSALYSWNNDIIQALLNICFPFTQIYVGKVVHTEMTNVIRYTIFWVTLLSYKLWFGYYFIVNPIVIPTLELYDDYMNFEHVSGLKTMVLLFVWSFPHFLVYLIDLSIWYAVWASVCGGVNALLDRQGAIRSARNLR